MWRQSKRLRRAVWLFGVQAERQLPIGLDIQWNIIRLREKSFSVRPRLSLLQPRTNDLPLRLDVSQRQPIQAYMPPHFF